MARKLKTIEDLIRLHEGLRLKPYTDTVGKLTIGVGRNLTDKGLTKNEVDYLLKNDIRDCTLTLYKRREWVAGLDPVRQAVLIDMAFNMGVSGLLKWKNTLRHVRNGDYQAAADLMRYSKWAGQVKTRAVRLVKMMETGKWPTR